MRLSSVPFPLTMPKGGIFDYNAGFKAGSGLFAQTIEFENPLGGPFSKLLK